MSENDDVNNALDKMIESIDNDKAIQLEINKERNKSIKAIDYKPKYTNRVSKKSINKLLDTEQTEKTLTNYKIKVEEYILDFDIQKLLYTAGLLKEDTKYILISKDGKINQINVEIPTFKRFIGKLFGDKYIKV